MSPMNDKDLEALADRIAEKVSLHPCALGLKIEDAVEWKTFAAGLRDARKVGRAVLVGAVITALLGMLVLGLMQKIRGHG